MNHSSKKMYPKKRKKGFTLIEITIAVSIFGLLSGIAIPNFSKARKATYRNICLNNLRQIESAKELWAFDYMAAPNAIPTPEDLAPYLNKSALDCPLGGNANGSSVSSLSSAKGKKDRVKDKDKKDRGKGKERGKDKDKEKKDKDKGKDRDKDKDKDKDKGDDEESLALSSYKINAMNESPECTLDPEHTL